MGDSEAKNKETLEKVLPHQFENNEVDLLVSSEGHDIHYRWKWILGKLGIIPYHKEIEGPTFQTHTSEECKISLIKANNLELFLHNANDRTLEGKFDLNLTDLSGKVWYTRENDWYRIASKKKENLLSKIPDLLTHFEETPDDSLIIDCCLKTKRVSTFLSKPFQIQEKQNYVENFQNLLKTGHLADMTFKFGEEVIPAHKLILCTQSSYFKTMFQSGMTEQENNAVTITDVDISVFRKILHFLYTGRIKDIHDFVGMTPEDVYDVYKASDKYQVMELRQICGNILCSKVTEDNAMIILPWIERHDDLNLKSRIFTFITIHYKSISKSDKWKLFVSQNPVLSSELLSDILDKHMNSTSKLYNF